MFIPEISGFTIYPHGYTAARLEGHVRATEGGSTLHYHTSVSWLDILVRTFIILIGSCIFSFFGFALFFVALESMTGQKFEVSSLLYFLVLVPWWPLYHLSKANRSHEKHEEILEEVVPVLEGLCQDSGERREVVKDWGAGFLLESPLDEDTLFANLESDVHLRRDKLERSGRDFVLFHRDRRGGLIRTGSGYIEPRTNKDGSRLFFRLASSKRWRLLVALLLTVPSFYGQSLPGTESLAVSLFYFQFLLGVGYFLTGPFFRFFAKEHEEALKIRFAELSGSRG